MAAQSFKNSPKTGVPARQKNFFFKSSQNRTYFWRNFHTDYKTEKIFKIRRKLPALQAIENGAFRDQMWPYFWPLGRHISDICHPISKIFSVMSSAWLGLSLVQIWTKSIFFKKWPKMGQNHGLKFTVFGFFLSLYFLILWAKYTNRDIFLKEFTCRLQNRKKN